MSKLNLLKNLLKKSNQRKTKLSIGIVCAFLFLNPTVSNAQIVIQPLTTNSPIFTTVRTGDGVACSAPSYSFASSATTGFYLTGGEVHACIGGSNVGGFDATGIVINSTAVHWSDLFLRRSAAKTLTIDTDGAGGALTLVDIKSAVQVQTSIGFNSSTTFTTTANKQLSILDNAGATGFELTVGTPTLGTCTGGTLVSGAHNSMGEITGNTSGSCILNFGTPNFANTPFCILNDETNLVAARVSARSASSITITGLTSGDAVQYICVGRIGT